MFMLLQDACAGVSCSMHHHLDDYSVILIDVRVFFSIFLVLMLRLGYDLFLACGCGAVSRCECTANNDTTVTLVHIAKKDKYEGKKK